MIGGMLDKLLTLDELVKIEWQLVEPTLIQLMKQTDPGTVTQKAAQLLVSHAPLVGLPELSYNHIVPGSKLIPRFENSSNWIHQIYLCHAELIYTSCIEFALPTNIPKKESFQEMKSNLLEEMKSNVKRAVRYSIWCQHHEANFLMQKLCRLHATLFPSELLELCSKAPETELPCVLDLLFSLFENGQRHSVSRYIAPQYVQDWVRENLSQGSHASPHIEATFLSKFLQIGYWTHRIPSWGGPSLPQVCLQHLFAP